MTKFSIEDRVITRAAFLLGHVEAAQSKGNNGTQQKRGSVLAVLEEFYISAVHLVALHPAFYQQVKNIALSRDATVEKGDPYEWILPQDFLRGIVVYSTQTRVSSNFFLRGNHLALGGINSTSPCQRIETTNTGEEKSPVLTYVTATVQNSADIFITLCAYQLATLCASSLQGTQIATWFEGTIARIFSKYGASTSSNLDLENSLTLDWWYI